MNRSTLVEILHLVAPVAGLAGVCISHVAVCRMRPKTPLLRGLSQAAAFGWLVLVLMEWAAWNEGEPGLTTLLKALVVDLPLFGCLAYGYANFVNLGQSSIRVRILHELGQSPAGLDPRDIRLMYDDHAMLLPRLERLVREGDLLRVGHRYRLGRRRWVRVALAVGAWRRFLTPSPRDSIRRGKPPDSQACPPQPPPIARDGELF